MATPQEDEATLSQADPSHVVERDPTYLDVDDNSSTDEHVSETERPADSDAECSEDDLSVAPYSKELQRLIDEEESIIATIRETIERSSRAKRVVRQRQCIKTLTDLVSIADLESYQFSLIPAFIDELRSHQRAKPTGKECRRTK